MITAHIVNIIKKCIRIVFDVYLSLIFVKDIADAWPRIKEAKFILLYPEGGFGHTIIGPDWLRRLHPHEKVLTLFAYQPNRHNFAIRDCWGTDKLIWIRQGIFFSPRRIYDNPALRFRLFNLLSRFLHWYLPEKTIYDDINALIAITPGPEWLPLDHPLQTQSIAHYYPLITNYPAPNLILPGSWHEKIRDQIFRLTGGTNRTCNFFLRGRGQENTVDESSWRRNAAQITEYLPTFRVLTESTYTILVTGDLVVPNEIRQQLGPKVLFADMLDIEPDLYLLYCGLCTDIHIGGLSGGSSFLYATDIPGLMLNAFPPGNGIPFTTVSYKWLYEQDGTLCSLDKMLSPLFYDHQSHGYKVVDMSPEEMAEVVQEFIRPDRQRPDGIDPASLEIDASWLRVANARLSPAWLKAYQRRGGSIPTARPRAGDAH